MVDILKRRTVRFYTDRRAEIIELLDHVPGLSAEYIADLEDARDMATERIQQLTNIAATGDVIVPLDRDRALERLLRDVVGDFKEKQDGKAL